MTSADEYLDRIQIESELRAERDAYRQALGMIAKLATWNECATAEPQVRQTKADLSNTLDHAIQCARVALTGKR